MSHPFSLNISDLEALEIELVTDEETAQVEGGILPGGCVTTLAIGEEGGYNWPPIVKEPPVIRPPVKFEPCEPVFTTLAVGEEGGGGYEQIA